MSALIAEILRKNNLSVTDSRKKILELFQEVDSALAHADIERKTGELYDRVTIYRTLQTFVEKGIIHTIPTPDNSIKYALCKEACTEGHHHDNHIHFMCDACGATYCLEHVNIPKLEMPEGFTADRTDVIVSGVCKQCNQSKS